MDEGEWFRGVGFSGLQMERAAGVGDGDEGGVGFAEVVEFAVAEPPGGLGLGDGVDAGAAAAPGGFGGFAEFEAGDGAEDGAGLGRDFLAVAEVAGLVIGDGRRRCGG